MVSTVLCEKCHKNVSPSIAMWNGMRLVFKCPDCGALSSRSGRFQELMQEVH